MALDNFGIVDYTRLYRGAQPDKKGFADLWQLGVREIMSLNGENPANHGWSGLVLPRAMNGMEGPAEVERLVADLHRSINVGRTVFVHCTYGRDRTGLIIGAYRIIDCGWNFSKMNDERLLYGDMTIMQIVDAEIVKTLHVIAAKRGLDF